MLTKLFKAPSKEDTCPNCGTACAATDVLCPNCGKNLDELFEQLPDSKETNDLFKMASKNLPFIKWLAPLLLLLSPLVVSVITVLRAALNMVIDLDQSFFQMFWGDVVYSTLVSSGLLLISVIPLFLCTTSFVRAKIGQRRVMIWGTVFSILSAITLYLALLTAYIMAAIRFQIGFGIPTPAAWVYFVIAGGMILIVLNWITAIRQEKTA
jgi:hypothetical protein